MNQYEIVRNIYHKVIAKCPENTFRNYNFTKTPITLFPLRICDTRNATCWPTKHETGGTIALDKAFMICSHKYLSATSTKFAASVKYMNFNTEQERYNVWQSYLTKFARFCICMDESTKLAPYMGDYTEPWTDERFKQYFELTDIEWQLIDTVIK